MLGDDIAEAFGVIFGGLYGDGLLHVKLRGDDDAGGSAASGFTGDTGQPAATPCKVQKDGVTYLMRQEEGYADGDVRLIILTRCEGIGLPEILTGYQVTFPAPGGTRYSIEGPATLDAAGSHVQARAREVRNG